VLVDLAVTWRLPGAAAGLLVAAGTYGAGALQEAAGLLPPWNLWSGLPTAAGLALLWTGVDLVARSGRLASWRMPVEPGATPVVAGGPTP
jgi:hypothetical protein